MSDVSELVQWSKTARWRLVLGHQQPILNPSWGQIQQSIDVMDGSDDRSFAAVELHDGRSLWAAGGNDGRFTVTYMVNIDTQESYSLADPSRLGPPIQLNVQGHPTEVPARWCVDRQSVLRAFKPFFDTGSIPNDLLWEVSY